MLYTVNRKTWKSSVLINSRFNGGASLKFLSAKRNVLFGFSTESSSNKCSLTNQRAVQQGYVRLRLFSSLTLAKDIWC